MELALNLGWIVVSIAIAWFATRDGCASGTQRATIVITIALLSALLFPAISMSDDLHVAVVLTDDVNSRRHNLAHSLVGAMTLFCCAVVFPTPPRAINRLRKSDRLVSAALAGFKTAVGLRAPPAVLA